MAEKLKEAFIDDAPEPPAPKDPREEINQDAQIITTISLDLQFRNIVNVNVKQYDTELRVIRIFVTDQGVPVDTSDYSNAYVQVRRPDGSFIVNTLSVLPGYYVLEISRAMVELSGICKADVTVSDGYGVATTMTFFLNVDASVITAEEYTEIPEFQALVAYRNDAQQAAENAQYSADDAYVSAEDAADSADAAATSATNAANSATAAADSASSASTSASSAAQDALSASSSAGIAETMRHQAENARDTAQSAANSANTQANNAATYAHNADLSAQAAASSATTATSMASSATTSATNAGVSAQEAKAWAVGPNGTPSAGTDTENAKYYYQQVAALFASLAASIIPYDNTTSHMTADDVQEAVDELKDMLPFKFGVDSNGKYGYYKAGEQTVTPFSSGAEGTLPVNPSSTTGMNIWIVTNPEDTSDTADIVY